jgi:hypothetical protein
MTPPKPVTTPTRSFVIANILLYGGCHEVWLASAQKMHADGKSLQEIGDWIRGKWGVPGPDGDGIWAEAAGIITRRVK